MSTTPENQNDKPVIIPWIATQRTSWSDPSRIDRFKRDTPSHILSFVDYFLWESSTECMVSVGMPTIADVDMWILWLSERADANDPLIQDAIQSCKGYTKPGTYVINGENNEQ
jgi:hypothetical protein